MSLQRRSDNSVLGDPSCPNGSTDSLEQTAHRNRSLFTGGSRSKPDVAARSKVAEYELANDVVGSNAVFSSPFGAKAAVFADYPAGGKVLRSVEDHIRQHVLPLLKNSPESSSADDSQAAGLLDDAHRSIVDATNAHVDGPDALDSVILTASGTSGAINRLIAELGLDKSSTSGTQPVVFIGPFEHPSDVRRWQESAAEVISIPENSDGHVDMTALERCVKHYRDRPLKVGVFSAVSSLTGLVTDADAVTELLHRHGALSLWDYSFGAAYVPIDMNPVCPESMSIAKDAIFFSGHKFIGARGGPGVLVVKKKLLSSVPDANLGKESPQLLSRGREADAIGTVRLGHALRLKLSVEAANIAKLEDCHVKRVRKSFAGNPNIVLLGHDDHTRHRLPFFSFLVRFGDRFLHYNFLGALLHDLFGVQVCVALRGLRGTRLLGISTNDWVNLERAVKDHNEVLKPGFLHVSFPYFMSHAEADYILNAIRFVALDGWKFLPQYAFNRVTGEWTWSSWLRPQQLSELPAADSNQRSKVVMSAYQLAHHRLQNMKQARSLARSYVGDSVEDFCSVTLSVSLEGLRWFVYPVEAVAALRSRSAPKLSAEISGPFQPEMYMKAALDDCWAIPADVPSNKTLAASRTVSAKAKLRRFVALCMCLSRSKRPWAKTRREVPGLKRSYSGDMALTPREATAITW